MSTTIILITYDFRCFAGNPPTLPKLLELEIPEKIGSRYKRFGITLLNDITGTLMETIDKDCRGNPDDISMRIFTEWMKGREGSPVTWKRLIDSLRRSKLNNVAKKIEKELK